MKINIDNYSEEEIENKLNEGAFFECYGSSDIYDDEDDGAYVNGFWYSLEYLEDSDEFYQCDDCYEWTPSNDLIYISNTCENVCENCYNNHEYFYCDECGNYISGSGNDTINGYMCDDCYENYCDNEEEEENGYDDRIYSYHAFKDWTPFKLEEEKNPYYIGFELEIVCKKINNTSKILDIMQEAWPVVFMHDSSLDTGGVEIISHPFTMKYFSKNKNKLKQAFEKIRELGAVSHDAKCCGLHFHFTRPKNEASINKMWLVLKTYQDEVLKYSRRDCEDFRHWASMIGGDRDNFKVKTLEYIDTAKNGGRYMALNNTNEKTIEFRFFRGTLIFDSFAASIELLNNLYKACISKKDLCNIDWAYLTHTSYAKKYALSHNITSKKIVKDYSIEFAKIVKKANKHLDNAMLILKTAYNDYIKNFKELNLKNLNYEEVTNDLADARKLLNNIACCKLYYEEDNYSGFTSYLDDAIFFIKDQKLKDEAFSEKTEIEKMLNEGGI